MEATGEQRRAPVSLEASALTRCRHRVFLDAAYPDELAAAAPNAGAVQRQEAAAAHRDMIRQRLVADDPDRWVVIEPDGPMARRADRTLEACRAGADRIWGAVLPLEADTGRRGRSEILLRDTERGGYIPVVVVNHKVTDPGRGAVTSDLFEWAPVVDENRKVRAQLRDQMRVAQLHRMLERHGLASPAKVAGAIGYGGDCILVHDLESILDDYDERFADRLEIARGNVATVPSQIGECRTCPWWPRCRRELAERRDVSLVAPGQRAVVLRELDVRTIDGLAGWTGDPPEVWPQGSFEDAIVVAKAWLADVPLVRRYRQVTVQRADVEIDVDMESYHEHGAYLWGTLLNTDVQSVYRPFVTWRPVPTEDEARSFAEFWTWLSAERRAAERRGKTFAAYCYSRSAEDKWLLSSARRFHGYPGVPSEQEVKAFISTPQWVDVYQAVTDQFVCPNGKGLKKIAPIAGHRWRDDEAGGEASMSWYREAVGYEGEPDPSQRARLLEYNEDDVIATKVLREWMSDRAVLDIPHIDDL
ncbi:MAG: TM0106 family RecB-like putative nuclease [Rhodococcus sp.]|uniref:TM0106 family RecB-like putative nuclease n=1 Tax=Rhodococcus TaxID=1827 RepID=UPI001699C29F|nr:MULTISPECIES: TM0106 family RecB-like putative nuclease [Rhodococcus]NLV80252.1 TM0106 family RecB-like putative nuclease [Rhodococcus sp. (in: high G+C Gram-positive bacteria)]